MRRLNCDTVMDGAFSPNLIPDVPEEKTRQHGGNHMAPPCWKLSHLVVIHAAIRFGLFKTLFNGPAFAGEPGEGFHPGGPRGVGDKAGAGGRVSCNSAARLIGHLQCGNL